MTAPDTTDHSSDVGKTEAQIETAHGETPGDRLGDTPVPDVPQTRDGAGNPITGAQADYAAQHGTAGSDVPGYVMPISISPATGAITTGGDAEVTHVALPLAHISRLREILTTLEQAVAHDALTGYRWAIDELRSLTHHAA